MHDAKEWMELTRGSAEKRSVKVALVQPEMEGAGGAMVAAVSAAPTAIERNEGSLTAMRTELDSQMCGLKSVVGRRREGD